MYRLAIILAAGLLLSGCGERGSGAESGSAPKGWQYSTSEREMNGQKPIFACVAADAPATGNPAQLCLLHTPVSYMNFITAPGFDFSCEKCDVRVTFDDMPAETTPAFRHSETPGESALIIGEQDGAGPITMRMRVALSQKFAVEAPLANGQTQRFEFTTAGIDRDKMTLEGTYRPGG